ncbi:hypothetical protein ITL14_004570, partial [Salmonella enterica]|nr:hypothetical protein [Salmonella enterica]EIJ0492713.1 hypothetical protein [Salmonella enterica]EJH1668388.1 hypothetical protein [Salmonella enterica]
MEPQIIFFLVVLIIVSATGVALVIAAPDSVITSVAVILSVSCVITSVAVILSVSCVIIL